MRAYSRDLRERVLARCDAGESSPQVAKHFEVSPAWVRRLVQRRREMGTIDPLPRRYGRWPKITPEHHQQFRAILTRKPDTTLKELKALTKVDVGLPQICRVLRKLGLSVKKKSSTPPSRIAPTSPKRGSSGTRRSRR